jgi:hypothetical protein
LASRRLGGSRPASSSARQKSCRTSAAASRPASPERN